MLKDVQKRSSSQNTAGSHSANSLQIISPNTQSMTSISTDAELKTADEKPQKEGYVYIKVGDDFFWCPLGWKAADAEREIRTVFKIKYGHIVSKFGASLDEQEILDSSECTLEFVLRARDQRFSTARPISHSNESAFDDVVSPCEFVVENMYYAHKMFQRIFCGFCMPTEEPVVGYDYVERFETIDGEFQYVVRGVPRS